MEANRIQGNGFHAPFGQGVGWWKETVSEMMVFVDRSGREEDGGGEPYSSQWFSCTVQTGRRMVEGNHIRSDGFDPSSRDSGRRPYEEVIVFVHHPGTEEDGGGKLYEAMV